MVVCGVLLATPVEYAAASSGLPLALLAWSVTEIIRYGYYFMNLMGAVPHFLVWLRQVYYFPFVSLENKNVSPVTVFAKSYGLKNPHYIIFSENSYASN